ncbi:ABC transporter ATP-binding protein [Vineibacter terrae]|uniref:ABC transporter ATP-binding protein n=1 Tax=Vineibacter terrae TaxID=2586908 RepID=A0A5C8PQA2_9HYPH|nr:ABC transporter ATP-binding protein [Vineibacter terrae]TXL77101.1 ABC transporter ATP-binding protein [Vineibacter terrae]
MTTAPLLEVDGLKTHFRLPHGELRAVDGVSFTLQAGRTLGVVGESGSGKSVLARSIIGLLPMAQAVEAGGRVVFDGRDLRQLPESAMRQVRGRQIAMIFQDPLTSLNPVMTVGRQIVQVLRQHTDLAPTAARERAVELLAEVGIPAPRQRAAEYAHRMSGGMRQRIVIAIALACNPRLLIADEPTTALDVTVQAQILDLLRRLQDKHAMALILITHNLGVVAEMCDDVAVMYAGRIVEQAGVGDILARPRMRYTQALLQSVPRIDSPSHVRLPVIPGQPPNLVTPPSGCRFAPRCAHRLDRCDSEIPPQSGAGTDHRFACWNPSPES